MSHIIFILIKPFADPLGVKWTQTMTAKGLPSIKEPPDPPTVGVRHSGRSCSLGVRHTFTRLPVEKMVKDDSSDHFFLNLYKPVAVV